MATTQTHSAISGIEHRDKVFAPNGREYRVQDTYTDAEGTRRVKLRHSHRQQMYVPKHRLNRLVRDEDWSYVPIDE